VPSAVPVVALAPVLGAEAAVAERVDRGVHLGPGHDREARPRGGGRGRGLVELPPPGRVDMRMPFHGR